MITSTATQAKSYCKVCGREKKYIWILLCHDCEAERRNIQNEIIRLQILLKKYDV